MTNRHILTGAARSIADGERERLAAASQLALDFVQHPGRFDPVALGALGEQGLAEFLSRVGRQIPFADSRDHALGEVTTAANAAMTSDLGWADQRCPEPRWFVDSVTTAIASGVCMSLTAALYVKFFGG